MKSVRLQQHQTGGNEKWGGFMHMGSEQFVLATPLLFDLKIRSNPAAIV